MTFRTRVHTAGISCYSAHFCPGTVCYSACDGRSAAACPPAFLIPRLPITASSFSSLWTVLCCSWPQTHPLHPLRSTSHLLRTARRSPAPLPMHSGSNWRRRTWCFSTITKSPAWVGLSQARDSSCARLPAAAPAAPGTKGQLCFSPTALAWRNLPLSRLRHHVPVSARGHKPAKHAC